MPFTIEHFTLLETTQGSDIRRGTKGGKTLSPSVEISEGESNTGQKVVVTGTYPKNQRTFFLSG